MSLVTEQELKIAELRGQVYELETLCEQLKAERDHLAGCARDMLKLTSLEEENTRLKAALEEYRGYFAAVTGFSKPPDSFEPVASDVMVAVKTIESRSNRSER